MLVIIDTIACVLCYLIWPASLRKVVQSTQLVQCIDAPFLFLRFPTVRMTWVGEVAMIYSSKGSMSTDRMMLRRVTGKNYTSMALWAILVFVVVQQVEAQDSCSDLTTWYYEDALLTYRAKALLNDLHYSTSFCGRNCTLQNGFSCLTEVRSIPWKVYNLTECDMITDACIGRVIVTNNCRTLDCCSQLNAEFMEKLPFYDTSLETSTNYYMKFYGANSMQIPCSQFTSNTFDRCLQYVDYGQASGDPGKCKLWENANKMENLAFELF